MPPTDTNNSLLRSRSFRASANQPSSPSSPVANSISSFVTAVEPNGIVEEYEDPESYEGDITEAQTEGTTPTASLDAGDRPEDAELEGLIRPHVQENQEGASLTPISPPSGYQPLNFRPTLLEPAINLILMTVYILLAASVVVRLHLSGQDREFRIASENTHLVAQYLPGLTATVTMLLFRQTARDTIRMIPYISMADQQGSINPGPLASKTVAGAFFPWTPLFLTPKSLLTVCLRVGSYLATFLVAFKSSLIGTRQTGATWVVFVRTQPAYFLICGYGVMALCNLLITWRLWSQSTGLRWDPISLTDFIALFANGNALLCFEGLEYTRYRKGRERGKNRASWMLRGAGPLRIGYWRRKPANRVGINASDIVYGIGIIDGPHVCLAPVVANASESPNQERHRSTEAGSSGTSRNEVKPTAKPLGSVHTSCCPDVGKEAGLDSKFSTPIESSREFANWFTDQRTPLCACKKYPHCIHFPYYVSPGLGTWGLRVWMGILTAALSACIYALVSGTYQAGFSVPNTWSPNSGLNATGTVIYLDGSEEINTDSWTYVVVFRVLPTQVAGWFGVWYLSLFDINMRFMQPFLGMFESPGTAEESISLSYLTASAVNVPLQAFQRGHYKVAWFSVLATISPLFPVVVSALFTISTTRSGASLTFSKSSFIIATTFIIVYWITLPFAWPRRYRRMPRMPLSLADLMGMCHQAQVVADGMFDMSNPKISREKLHAAVLLRDYKYLFGWYLGRDGKLHLGFDVAETEMQGALHNVRWVPPKASWIRSDGGKPSLVDRTFRRHKARISTLTGAEENELDDFVSQHSANATRREESNDGLYMHGALSTGREM